MLPPGARQVPSSSAVTFSEAIFCPSLPTNSLLPFGHGRSLQRMPAGLMEDHAAEPAADGHRHLPAGAQGACSMVMAVCAACWAAPSISRSEKNSNPRPAPGPSNPVCIFSVCTCHGGNSQPGTCPFILPIHRRNWPRAHGLTHPSQRLASAQFQGRRLWRPDRLCATCTRCLASTACGRIRTCCISLAGATTKSLQCSLAWARRV